MIYLKTPEELQLMRRAADLASRTLGEVAKWIKPGVTTRRIDQIAREYIQDHGGTPTCLGYEGFPGAVCCELNEIVVHGFPSGYELRPGDILGIDLVTELDGFNGDMCYTFPVDEIDPKVMQLLFDTKQSLQEGIDKALAGNRIGDIANAVQTYCEQRGYGVVREMCGHGIGRSMHEDPEVPNYGRAAHGTVLKPGMCICIEPMITLGKRQIVIEKDGWQCRTRDRQPSAHYEHTIAITRQLPEVLTTFDYVKQELGDRFI